MTSPTNPTVDPVLRRADRSSQPDGPLVLVILDGVGDGRGDDFDAVALAQTPNLDWLKINGLVCEIAAHGTSVGLPTDADMGNSEVGHNTMGAGRILDQGATRVDKALESGAIWGPAWIDLVGYLKATGGALHLLGLLSDGNVHSNMIHLKAIIDRAASEKLRQVRVHALLDGRDVPDHSAERYLAQLEEDLQSHNDPECDYRLASAGGRMKITMDRYGADWPMVAAGWRTHVLGQGRSFDSAKDAMSVLRQENPGVSDQYFPEFVIAGPDGEAVGKIEDGDAVICFNFRGDRALEISQAFVLDEFEQFDRGRRPEVFFAGLMLYDGDTNMPPNRLVEPDAVSGTVSELLANSGVSQFACAETQKFGHVTYFWNGNRSDKFDPALETYQEIPSDGVPFEQRPWMKSAETADAVCSAIEGGGFQFIRANFAGGDMVGHSGDLHATVLAVESIDLAIGRIVKAVKATRGTLVVTADHGNAEDMVQRDASGDVMRGRDSAPIPKTSHSLNGIPFVVKDFGDRELKLNPVAKPGLANIAASVCVLLGFEAPSGFEPPLVLTD